MQCVHFAQDGASGGTYDHSIIEDSRLLWGAGQKKCIKTVYNAKNEMYSNIASAIIASDDTVAESELMFTFQLADRLSVYAENNLSQEAKKKMMVLES